jgi:hypothetical protein
MSRSNADKKAERRERDVELAQVKKKFSTEPDNLKPYPQPQRCLSCGNWVTMMCMIGTEYCSLGCESKGEEPPSGSRGDDREGGRVR